MQKVNLTKWENFLTSYLHYNEGIRRLMHDIPRFSIIFLGENITLKTQNVQGLFTILAPQNLNWKNTQFVFLNKPAVEHQGVW